MPDTLVEVWEVRYPDNRQENGLSTALFRDLTLASRFSKRHRGDLKPKMVTVAEFNHLRRNGFFEGGGDGRMK
jgi:hypothetical protein